MACLLCAGFAFFLRFGQAQEHVAWHVAWVWTVLATAGILVVLPVLALLEGCGLVAEVARFRTLQSVAANVVLWTALVAGAGLAAAALFATVNLAAALVWLLTARRAFLADLFSSVGRRGSTGVARSGRINGGSR